MGSDKPAVSVVEANATAAEVVQAGEAAAANATATTAEVVQAGEAATGKAVADQANAAELEVAQPVADQADKDQ
jgi:hypothetical protein